MKTNARVTLALGTLLGVAAVSYFVGVVRAGGAPTMTPLVYSGTLLDNAAHPVTVAHNIGLTLWDDAALTGSAHQACNVPPASITPVNGRFSITLDTTTCVAAVHNTPDLWVAIDVDGTAMPRTHLGAVPYALEATHATASDSATSAGRTVITSAGQSISAGGAFCGVSAAHDGNYGGYAAANAVCRAVSGCNATAHVCNGDEMMRSAALSLFPTPRLSYVRYAIGAFSPIGSGSNMTDCNGFTTNSANLYSQSWTPDYPSENTCDLMHSLACCD
jgi:hypothetical protein